MLGVDHWLRYSNRVCSLWRGGRVGIGRMGRQLDVEQLLGRLDGHCPLELHDHVHIGWRRFLDQDYGVHGYSARIS